MLQIQRKPKDLKVPNFDTHPYAFTMYVGVSKKSGTPKSWILIGCYIINHPVWGTTIFGNTHVINKGIELIQMCVPWPKRSWSFVEVLSFFAFFVLWRHHCLLCLYYISLFSLYLKQSTWKIIQKRPTMRCPARLFWNQCIQSDQLISPSIQFI